MSANRPPTSDWPAIVYGTAWKGERTAELTHCALAAGFRGVDTAGQPKHYHEPGVGAGLQRGLADLGLERGDVWVQSKFTPMRGQGREIPYEPDAEPAEQVRQSLAASLANLGVEALDSYLLHAPAHPRGLTDTDWAIWRALEAAVDDGRVQRIGISNAAPAHVEALATQARRPPAVVQNRCFASTAWDRAMRGVCAEHGIGYQGFSLLTANAAALRARRITELAERHQITVAQLVFAFARGVGMLPLTGTTQERHMAEDLASVELALDADTIAAIEALGEG